MEMDDVWNTCCWHLVHTKPRQETRAEHNLMTLNIETYTPMYKARRVNQYTGEVDYRAKPLFPGYIFARFKINDLYHKVCLTRGVRSLVWFDNRPPAIDEEVIMLIQSRQGKDGLIRIGEEISPGDEVIIKNGPLKNLAAIFERATDANRISLLLETVSYQARIIVDRDSVRRVDNLDEVARL